MKAYRIWPEVDMSSMRNEPHSTQERALTLRVIILISYHLEPIHMTHMSGLIVMGIYAMSLPSVSLLLTKNMTYGSSFGSMTQTQFVLWQFVS